MYWIGKYGLNNLVNGTVGGNGGAAFTTVVNGGAGTDTLTITYAGVTGLESFVSRMRGSDGSIRLTDASGGSITASGIELLVQNGLTVAGIGYKFVDGPGSNADLYNARGRSGMHEASSGLTQGTVVDSTGRKVVMLNRCQFFRL